MRKTIEILTVEELNEAISPILKELNELKSYISTQPPRQYYRNKDLKEIYGLSDNTIKEYRDKNIIPHTSVGNIPFYPVIEFNQMLQRNSNFDMLKK